MVKAYAALKAGGQLEPFEYEFGELAADEVEIDVVSCGICHSDISMIDNSWQMSQYPLVAGHEVAGKIAAVGSQVPNVKVGDSVGLGWFSKSCLHCTQCLSGDHNLCRNGHGETIVGRHGGFSNKVRCHWIWATPLPETLDRRKAGPLFCGGITVFNPIVQCGVKPTDRVGVVGIGGLGHLAIQFLNKWGCEVTAFTSSDDKRAQALEFGAHHTVSSVTESELSEQANRFDFILVTVNVDLNWELYQNALAPKGTLHVVGAVLNPIPVGAFTLLSAQRSVSGTPLGSPATNLDMIEFCARHGIAPITEHFPMSKVNDAIEHLKAGKARYRIVLENDLG